METASEYLDDDEHGEDSAMSFSPLVLVEVEVEVSSAIPMLSGMRYRLKVSRRRWSVGGKEQLAAIDVALSCLMFFFLRAE